MLVFDVSVEQSSNSLSGFSMELMDEMSWRLTLDQTLTRLRVLFKRDSADQLQQIVLTVGHKQGLKLSKVAQFFGRTASTDPALMATKTIEKTFELQIMLGQAWDIIAV